MMSDFAKNWSCAAAACSWPKTGPLPDVLTAIATTNLPAAIFYAVTSLALFSLVYFGWIRPVNIRKDLSATGFNHLQDGTYRCVESAKRSFKELVNISQRRRKAGDVPPVYPNGWFALIEAEQVPPGQVRHVAALGENFAVFRTLKGEVSVLDAYCPHLGANMAIGGSVQGDCLECPFHKWQFSAETGACTSVPYSAKPPAAAKVKKWISREVNHFIFVWYHAEGLEPAWKIESREEIEKGAWRLHGRTDMMVSCHIQDIQENGADIGHLEAIHGPNVMAGVDVRHCGRAPYQFLRHRWSAKWEASEEEKHKGIMTLASIVRVFDKYDLTQVTAHVEQVGPSYVELNLQAVWGPMLLVMTVTPVEPLLQRVMHRMYAPAYAGPFARGLLYIETLMIQRDVMMWNHKKYESKPFLVKEDASIVRHRRWYSQFYTENSPRMLYRRENMEW